MAPILVLYWQSTLGEVCMSVLNRFYLSLVVFLSVAWPSVSLAMVCASPPNVVIPDDSINTNPSDANPGTAATIDVVVPASFEGTVTDLDVQLTITHAYVGDLIVTLTSPAGTVVTLIDRPGRAGGVGGHGCSQANIDVVLDDSAATEADLQCSATDPAIGGTQQPFGNLSDFVGDAIAGTWTLTAVDYFPLDEGTFIANGICFSGATTPVTISQFESRRKGRSLEFKWETSSESFNLGFDLWGNVNGEWQQLNKRLIEADSLDSVEPQRYRRKVNILKVDGDVTEVGISSFSTSGQEDFYGPFDIGEQYGEAAVPKYVDWTQQRSLHDKAMAEAGYVKIKKRWVKNNSRRQARQKRQEDRFHSTILDIESAGIHQVSYEDLLAAGVDLKGMPVHKLSLTRGGVAVPRRVFRNGSKSKRRFGPGSEIVFYGYGPSESDSRYVATEPYLLSLDASKVIDLPSAERFDFGQLSNDLSSWSNHRFTHRFGDKNLYSFGLEGDGWYDTSIRAIRSIGTKFINLKIDENAVLEDAATIELLLYGVTDFPDIDVDGDGITEPDHHYKVYLNRTDFPNPISEGYSRGKALIQVSQEVIGQLKHGDNEIQIELIPDNGHNLDLAYFINGSISYSKPNIMSAKSLSIDELEGSGKTIVRTNEHKVDAVYAVDSENNVAIRAFNENQDGIVEVLQRNNTSQRGPVILNFVSDGGYLKPKQIYKANNVDADELDLSDVDYVVIADASLRGETLQRFVSTQNEMGRRTKAVSSQTIFDAYSGGNPLPRAIATYLSDQAQSSPYQYVLLVGGHTYNYRGYNVDESNQPINLIPSFYRATEFITKQIPSAVPFVDFDRDGAPDRAIGRWPVRDKMQLEHVVNKTLAWHADGSHKDSKTALFIADGKDQQSDFAQTTRRLISSLGLDLNPWQAPNEVLLDAINADESIPQDEKLNTARSRIIDGVNEGPALTVYSGHGAPGVWGRQKLIYGSVSDQFSNGSRPTFMLPLACYTTYYEAPNIKSLPEVLFTDSAGGAVAISGAALLSDSSDNERFGRALLKKMSVSGMDLGSAVLSVKRDMLENASRHQTVVYNWVTLGDPTLSFNLPNVEPLPDLNEPRGDRR